MRNYLTISRMRIVTRDGLVSYDENFHKGVNIIRGDNSSGKSTLTHFMLYGLGGDFTEFVPEAIECAFVEIEVDVSGVVITLKRHLEYDADKERLKSKMPMLFFYGTMEESIQHGGGDFWRKYGYRTTKDRKSFSNVLFELIGLPIVKAENNITIHQLLRLLYVDQESPTSSLFFYEQFDSQLTRETIADLVLGVYSEELYDNKRRLGSVKKELEDVKSEIKVTSKFFSDPLSLNSAHMSESLKKKQGEIDEIEAEIQALRRNEQEAKYDRRSKLEFEELEQTSIAQRKIVLDLEEKYEVLDERIVDTQYFIESLNNRVKALTNSVLTREFLGLLPLEFCPECLTEIKKKTDGDSCQLCKENLDDSFGAARAKRMEQEIRLQVSESEKLVALYMSERDEAKAKIRAEKMVLMHLQSKVNKALSNVRSYTDETLDKLIERKGFIEGEMLQFRTLLENAQRHEELKEKRNRLSDEAKTLEKLIRSTELEHERLKEEINSTVRQEGVYLLNNDLNRQDEFKNANEFFIDYSNNIAFLSNKHSKYSASSNFYLKVVARFSIFLASLTVERMRYPRFLFADNMEDKGIEPERAQNLQQILINRIHEIDVEDCQLIYTTSYLTEELENSPYVVGEYYSKANPSLKNIAK